MCMGGGGGGGGGGAFWVFMEFIQQCRLLSLLSVSVCPAGQSKKAAVSR